MHWTPAEFYNVDGDALFCTLCPFACRLREGEVGVCRMRQRRGEILETASFTSVVRHLDPVERKPFYHYFPGTKVLTLAPPGCTFRCHYCTNYSISQYGRIPEASHEGVSVDPEQTVVEACRQQAAVALSYSEPILAAELTLALAQAGQRWGVEVLWKSNGFITPGALARLAPCLAAVNLDLKAADEQSHHALTGAPLAPVLETLRGLRRFGVWVEVSTPVIPRVNADPDSLRRLAALIAEVDPTIPWHLLRFTPDFHMQHLPPTSVEVLRQAAEIGRKAGLQFVYVERALGEEGRNTYCPCCGNCVITRGIWETIHVALVAGACPTCGQRVPGRWRERADERASLRSAPA